MLQALNGQNGTVNPLPIFVLKTKLNALFKRSDSSPWGNAEEHYLVDVVKRPDCLAEMAEIERFFAKGSFCPQSVKSLLEHWTEILDRARNHNENTKRNSTTGFSRSAGTANEGIAFRYSRAYREKQAALSAENSISDPKQGAGKDVPGSGDVCGPT